MESVAYVFLRRWTVSGEWFLQRFFFRNLQQWRNHDFRWPNLNAFFMLHIFIVAKRQQHREKKRKKNQTRTENHLRMKIKKKQRERWGREYEKFHFMNVVYRICADSALLVYKPTVLAKSIQIFSWVSSPLTPRNLDYECVLFRFRLLVFDLFMFIY